MWTCLAFAVIVLGSAVDNLVQNAIKFTPQEGHVLVTARAKGARLCINVADECGGLAPGVADQIFTPFEQRGVNRSGLGLGLSISRKAVRRMGGDIIVQDVDVRDVNVEAFPGRPGHVHSAKGCVFTIELSIPPQ
jgi:signal transduction histidine kinase